MTDTEAQRYIADTLPKMHALINKKRFSGKLRKIAFSLKHAEPGKRKRKALAWYEWGGGIVFTHEYFALMEKQPNPHEHLTTVLLHEMVHQFMFENWLDMKAAHGRAFMECAREHGLFSEYKHGSRVKEYLIPPYGDILL